MPAARNRRHAAVCGLPRILPRSSLRSVVWLGALALGLAAPVWAQGGLLEVESGDVLSVFVRNEKELTADYVVSQDGMLFLPHLGRVPVQGKTTQEIEVLVASASPGNPYHPGEKELLPGSGLYCETVIKTRQMLLVPNALEDEKWRNNPDIKLGMISYLGYPIFLPQGEVFGTICILDIKENPYSETYKKLLLQFKELIEAHLELLHTNCLLQDALIQVKTLQGMLPICAHCKKIRNDQDNWQPIESYISQHSGAKFSHGVCPDCLKEHYADCP